MEIVKQNGEYLFKDDGGRIVGKLYMTDGVMAFMAGDVYQSARMFLELVCSEYRVMKDRCDELDKVIPTWKELVELEKEANRG